MSVDAIHDSLNLAILHDLDAIVITALFLTNDLSVLS